MASHGPLDFVSTLGGELGAYARIERYRNRIAEQNNKRAADIEALLNAIDTDDTSFELDVKDEANHRTAQP